MISLRRRFAVSFDESIVRSVAPSANETASVAFLAVSSFKNIYKDSAAAERQELVNFLFDLSLGASEVKPEWWNTRVELECVACGGLLEDSISARLGGAVVPRPEDMDSELAAELATGMGAAHEWLAS